LQIKKGDYAKAAKCAYDELDKLEKKGTWTVDELLYAMNLYIVNFDSGKFAIKPNDMTFIARASSFIKKLPPTTIIEVGGHTDNKGLDPANQTLSENRSKSVYDALLQFGIPANMLQSKGYGSKKPKESNDTPDGMFRNRRIEYTAASK
jgi:outer membrane protein OmpA-like peptidoglycan-associated protein